MNSTKKTPNVETLGVSREETLPIAGSVITSARSPIGRWQFCLGGEFRIGFDTCVCAVEAELLVLFTDADTEGHFQDHPNRERGG